MPNSPVGFKEDILNVKAIAHVNTSPEAEHFSTQDRALVSERDRQFRQQLQKSRDKLLDSRNLTWMDAPQRSYL